VFLLGKLLEEGGPLCFKDAVKRAAKRSRRDFK
jgi:hypothetical protein